MLLSRIGKQSTGDMTFKWLTKERQPDWLTISAFGAAWAAGAATTGTITVPVAEAPWVNEGDLLIAPADSDVVLYVDSIVLATGVITMRTYDNTTTVDFSAGTTGALKLFRQGNSFELGTGKGTIRSQQPVESLNRIQIIQTPFGVTTTTQHVENEAGKDELSEQEEEKMVEHLFDIEKTFFTGLKHKATVGYMNGTYEQYFAGGLKEVISTYLQDEAGSSLTQAEFATFVKKLTRYSKKPVIFASDLIFEALTYWSEQKLQVERNEQTLGMSVAYFLTPYGDRVNVVPHRDLLINEYDGSAYGVDLDDIHYKYLQGLDTHLEMDIQDPDLKQKINEFRTWFGPWIGNEKRHALLENVASIA
jgi:hypothetical protein